MISVNRALEIIKENLPERKTAIVSTADALGYVLAEKIRATIPSPPYTNSGVDGFAVSWQDKVGQASQQAKSTMPLISERNRRPMFGF